MNIEELLRLLGYLKPETILELDSESIENPYMDYSIALDSNGNSSSAKNLIKELEIYKDSVKVNGEDLESVTIFLYVDGLQVKVLEQVDLFNLIQG